MTVRSNGCGHAVRVCGYCVNFTDMPCCVGVGGGGRGSRLCGCGRREGEQVVWVWEEEGGE